MNRRRMTLDEFFGGRLGEHQHVQVEPRGLDEMMVKQVGVGLVEAFIHWLDVNKGKINPKLYDKLRRELRKANTTTVPGVVGLALWMFGVINDMGCRMMFGPYGYRIVRCDGYDRGATERLATMIYTALQLQSIGEGYARHNR